MAFTAMMTTLWELREGATAGAGGRTTFYRTLSTRAENCDRQNMQEQLVSNDVSALSLALSPMGLVSSTSSNLIFMLYAQHPIDVQFGTSGATLSALQAITGAWTFSAMFVTTGSNATRVMAGVFGGSAATVTVTM